MHSSKTPNSGDVIWIYYYIPDTLLVLSLSLYHLLLPDPVFIKASLELKPSRSPIPLPKAGRILLTTCPSLTDFPITTVAALASTLKPARWGKRWKWRETSVDVQSLRLLDIIVTFGPNVPPKCVQTGQSSPESLHAATDHWSFASRHVREKAQTTSAVTGQRWNFPTSRLSDSGALGGGRGE